MKLATDEMSTSRDMTIFLCPKTYGPSCLLYRVSIGLARAVQSTSGSALAPGSFSDTFKLMRDSSLGVAILSSPVDYDRFDTKNGLIFIMSHRESWRAGVDGLLLLIPRSSVQY